MYIQKKLQKYTIEINGQSIDKLPSVVCVCVWVAHVLDVFLQSNELWLRFIRMVEEPQPYV